MTVDKKIMYHLDNEEVSPIVWGNGHLFGNSYSGYSSNFYEKLMQDNQALSLLEEIDLCLKGKESRTRSLKLLREARNIILNSEDNRIEKIVEEVRTELHKGISRKKAIFLCDEQGLEYWKKRMLSNNEKLSLVKVSVTGELFETYGSLFPKKGQSEKDIRKQAYEYWNPVNNPNDITKEFLFVGSARVLENVKIK